MKTTKSRALLFISVITIVSGLTWALKAQTRQEQPKRYSVSLTLDQWSNAINGMEFVKNKLKNSDLPSKEVTYINDSLFGVIQSEFVKQINAQIASEKPKTEVKTDSATKTKKN